MSEKNNDTENKVKIQNKIDDEDDFIVPEPKRFDLNLNMVVKVGIFLLLAIIVILLLVIINNGGNADSGIPAVSRAESSQSSKTESIRETESMSEGVSETTEQPSKESSEVSESKVSEVSVQEVSKETSRLKMLVVDRVVNKSRSEAERILKEKGFKVKVNELYSDEVAKNIVMSQTPAYFTLFEEGGTITIDVSLGRDPLKKIEESVTETTESPVSVVSESDVPVNEGSNGNSGSNILSYDIPVINIAGREKNDAENILKSQGFKVQTVYMSSPNVRKGYVIEQSPAGGIKQKYGSVITLYVSKGLEVTVSFETNGGTATSYTKVLEYGGKYGTLPVPTRENCDFLGWYTGLNKGQRVTENTIVAQSYDHILYAMWKAKPISDWVLDKDVPRGARVAEMKWTYTVTKTISSELPVMENGWKQAGSYWKEVSSGANYYADFGSGVNSGYNQNDKYYAKYNHQFLSKFDNGAQKREVTTKFHTYLYWHWCSNITSVPPESMPIASRYDEDIYSPNGNYLGRGTIWEVFESKDEGKQSSGKFVMEIKSRYSYWWNRVTVYYQTYKDYRKFYQYYKVENKESRTPVNETEEIGNIKRYVKYYLA